MDTALGMWLVFGLTCLAILETLALDLLVRRLRDFVQENNRLSAQLFKLQRADGDMSQLLREYPNLRSLLRK